ncbi:MAG: hypothetical protein F6K30_08195 [Cyanothece sp. SIO2G6]|nr:hypothetical protein [Cyanothece sp. SIO2G6]
MKANLKANQTAKTTRPSQPTTGQPSQQLSQQTASTLPLPSSPPTHTPSVPISVYRDLADELKVANSQVKLLTSQNEALQQQNQSLQAEVVRVIESAVKLQHLLQRAPHSNSTPVASTLNGNIDGTVDAQAIAQQTIAQQTIAQQAARMMAQAPVSPVSDEVIADLDQRLTTALGATIAAKHQDETKICGPYCDLPDNHQSQPDGNGSEASQQLNQQLNQQLSWQTLETEFLTEQTSGELTGVDPSLGGDRDSDKAKPINGLWLTLTLIVVIVTAFSAGFLVVLPFIQVDSE